MYKILTSEIATHSFILYIEVIDALRLYQIGNQKVFCRINTQGDASVFVVDPNVHRGKNARVTALLH